MLQIESKIILITGAASGIGFAIAEEFAKYKATVILSDINAKQGDRAAAKLREQGGKAQFIQADVTDQQQVADLIKQIVEQHGRLDGAVNNAGVEGDQTRIADIDEQEFDQIMSVNVKGVWLCMKAEIQQMLQQERGGAIVNISSVAGLIGAHSMGAYAASKHAVIGLTKTAAVEYAKKKVRVNAVCPAVIRTPMYERAIEMSPQLEKLVVSVNPSKRLGETEEVAQAVLWLISDASSFTTGAALTVDGGLTAQ